MNLNTLGMRRLGGDAVRTGGRRRPLPHVPNLRGGGRLWRAGLAQVTAHEEQFSEIGSFERAPRL